MRQLPVSAIILTDRSDHLFDQAVSSVSWASEIVIIDNNADLDHKKYAKNKQFTVRSLPNAITNFASIRNLAMADTQHDWVFFLDSDEQLSEKDVPKLAAVIDDPSIDGAIMFRSDVFYGKKLSYGEAGHRPIVRMVRKRKTKFVGAVHEVPQVEGKMKHLNAEILHFAHPSISEFISDVSRYAQLVATQTPAKSFWQNLLELLLFPPGKLLFNLFIQGGIADGWRGVIYAYCMSLHSLLVRIYRYEQMANQSRPSSI